VKADDIADLSRWIEVHPNPAEVERIMARWKRYEQRADVKAKREAAMRKAVMNTEEMYRRLMRAINEPDAPI
jgi:hypothetical protein